MVIDWQKVQEQLAEEEEVIAHFNAELKRIKKKINLENKKKGE